MQQAGAVNRERARFISNPHFWAVVVLFGISVVLQYPQQFLVTTSPSVFSFLGLTRHAVERILLLLPIGYAAFVFGTVAGFVSLVFAAAIMLPRVFLVSAYFPDALLETIGILLIGAAGNLQFRSYRKERERRERMLSNLETAHRQLQSHAQIVEDHEKRLATLNHISNIVSQSLELSQILDRAVDTIFDLIRVDGAWIYLLSEKEPELVLAAHRGVTEECARLKVGYGISGKVAETGQPLIMGDAATDAGAPRPAGQQLRSLLVVPLRSKGQVNGALGINSLTYRAYQPGDLDLLSAIGDQISVAIDNARLFKRAQEAALGLRASEQRYRQLFESAHDAIWVHDLDGNLVAVNKAAEEMTGYRAEELLTMNVRSFLSEESLNLAGNIRNKLLVERRWTSLTNSS